jgi:hypothetical protein
MSGIIVSTVVYFVASYYIKRQLDDIDIPKSFTRSVAIFSLALILAYGSAALVDWLSA